MGKGCLSPLRPIEAIPSGGHGLCVPLCRALPHVRSVVRKHGRNKNIPAPFRPLKAFFFLFLSVGVARSGNLMATETER